jgi:2-dehydro-3-deoxyphosphogluconate aldolase / (4S)-4-hydroxy-2-oxoglutarate aldolase
MVTGPDGGAPGALAGLRAARLLAIVRGGDAASAEAASRALLDSGVHHLEVTLTAPHALDVIASLARTAPAGAVIGAGTVVTPAHAQAAADAGAAFVVTPAVTSAIDEAARLGLPVVAGALTPTEALQALDRGATFVKLFPASLGGPAYLKALRDPLPDVPFVAVGGVDAAAAPAYLAAGAVAVGVGSPLVGDAVSGGSLDALRERAAAFLAAVAAAPA